MAACDFLRLVGTPGTNKVMAAELVRLAHRALGARPPEPRKAGTGALVYPFDPALAALAVSYHRTATRALWDLFSSQARRLEPLYDELADDVKRDRRPWLWDGASISVRVRNVGAFAAGERQIVGTVKNALVDGAAARGLRLRVDADAPDLHVTVRMHDDTVFVSLDLAGASLSQRGYRARHGAAPLREHLAAVLLMLARHHARTEILLDPMCGAGTICVEAALMARAAPLWTPPRVPACMRLPPFAESSAWSPEQAPLFPDTRARVIGNELDPRGIAAARANGRAAAVDVTWLRGDFRALTRERVEQLGAGGPAPSGTLAPGRARPRDGLILCNPPYGHRLPERDLIDLYRDLRDWCDQFHGWHAGFLVANREFEHAFGRRPRIRKPLDNGSLHAYFYLYEL